MVWFDLYLADANQQGVNDQTRWVLVARFGVFHPSRVIFFGDWPILSFNREIWRPSSLAFVNLISHDMHCMSCPRLQALLIPNPRHPTQSHSHDHSSPLSSPCIRRTWKTGVSATIIDRAISAIATVKAFNATTNENSRATLSFNIASNQPISRLELYFWYGMMSLFVQGFWFGAKLFREHNAAAGDVMAVFRTCLIATSNIHNSLYLPCRLY